MDMPKFRDYTERELKIINGFFTPYLFYENINSRERRCICSYCGSEYTVTNDNFEIFTAYHNEWVTCEKCRQRVQAKSKGKAKSCQNLYESHRVVTFYKVNENEVRVIADEAVKRYNYEYNPKIKFYKSSRYIIKPGAVRQYKYSYYYDWREQKSFGEPFHASSNGGCYWVKPDNSYKIIGLERLGATFLKYNMLKEYLERAKSEKALSYLCQFAIYPQIEMLQKLGYYDIVKNLVELKNKSYPYVNWGADSLDKFLKLSKAELKEFRANNGDLQLLKMVYLMKKHFKAKKPIQKAIEIRNQIEGAYISKADFVKDVISQAKRYGIEGPKVVNYLIKKQTDKKTFYFLKSDYFDYISMAKDLGYDFSEHNVVFPPNLTRAHDLANETHIIWLEEKKAKEEAERDKAAQKTLQKKDRQYSFTDGEFLITVPHSTKEILEEGRKQKHCVGGYVGRHMEGKLTICFLRTCKKPDEPLYTIEMHNKSLKQVQGFQNRTPLTTAAKLFFDKWLEWVKLGSKRDKKGTPILVKTLAETTA